MKKENEKAIWRRCLNCGYTRTKRDHLFLVFDLMRNRISNEEAELCPECGEFLHEEEGVSEE